MLNTPHRPTTVRTPLDTDALVRHTTAVLTDGSAALRHLFAMRDRPARSPNDTVRIAFGKDPEGGFMTTVTWTDRWIDVVRRAQEIWESPVAAFLCADRALDPAALAQQLQSDLIDELAAHARAGFRTRVGVTQYEQADRDWNRAAQGSEEEADAQQRIEALRCSAPGAPAPSICRWRCGSRT